MNEYKLKDLIDIKNGMDYYFFFQAEDGIRDLYVTGVQTCALPIYRGVRYQPYVARSCGDCQRLARFIRRTGRNSRKSDGRSEERRVGKECRCRWWLCPTKKKMEYITKLQSVICRLK